MLKKFTDLQVRLAETQSNEEGAAMVEYGLLVAFIAIIALVGVKALGVNVGALFNSVKFS